MPNNENFDLKGALDNLENLPTTIEWLKLLKHKHNNCSDYRVAKILGLTQQGVSGLMLGKNVMSDVTAVKIAQELELSPLLVVMAAIRERTKNEALKDSIDALPKEFFKAGCYILLGFSLSAIHYSTYFS